MERAGLKPIDPNIPVAMRGIWSDDRNIGFCREVPLQPSTTSGEGCIVNVKVTVTADVLVKREQKNVW